MLLKYPVSSWSILITRVLNCASDRLAISSLLSCIFFWSFELFFHLGHLFFLSSHACYIVRGGALGICQGGATHVAALWCCMWGRGLRGSNGACFPLCQFSVTSPTTHNRIGPFWSRFWVGGVVHALRPCGSLQQTLLWGWEFLLLVPRPPQVFSVRGLRLYFRCWSLGLLSLFQSSVVPPSFSSRECGTTLSASHRLAMGPLCLAARFRPPTGLDECFFFNSLVVGFPYSSIFCQFWLFFVFKFVVLVLGCTRRHSVSTYASILARCPH